MQNKDIYDTIIEFYRNLIKDKYPDKEFFWPLLTGNDVKIGEYKNWIILIYENKSTNSIRIINSINITKELLGFEDIDESNIEIVRENIENKLSLRLKDGVVILPKQTNGVILSQDIEKEIKSLLRKHEMALGISFDRIFLSHKGADKDLVRRYKMILEELGFKPWLDEEAMTAGTELERGILQGFRDSCAAIFFITPNFKDEDYLAKEVDYAIREKNLKKDKFSIITLVFEENGQKGNVPDLLHRYVWKEPKNDLEALKEILRALPIKVGPVQWKNN